MAQEVVGFERDIRPLFRERDVSSMSSVFDLSSYLDVRANAEEIYGRPDVKFRRAEFHIRPLARAPSSAARSRRRRQLRPG